MLKWDLTVNIPVILSFVLTLVPLVWKASQLVSKIDRVEEKQDDLKSQLDKHEASDERHFDQVYGLLRDKK